MAKKEVYYKESRYWYFGLVFLSLIVIILHNRVATTIAMVGIILIAIIQNETKPKKESEK